jgi:hypothetical protein
MFDLISITSVIGFIWTVLLCKELLKGHHGHLLSKYYLIPFNVLFLTISLYIVANEMTYVERLLLPTTTSATSTASNTIQYLLDRPEMYGYNSTDILILAKLLDKNGRYEYAKFQLSTDTLAPPAIATFISSVLLCTVSNKMIYSTCMTIVWIYLISVLLANSLTPVFFLNYEYYLTATSSTTTFENSSSNNVNIFLWFLKYLLFIIPWLDHIKYTFHGIAWLLMLLDWIIQLILVIFVGNKTTTMMEKDDNNKKVL